MARLGCALLAGFVGLAVAGCNPRQGPGSAEATNNAVTAIPVEVETLGLGPIEATLRTFATLEAEQDVKVFSRTANRVLELLVEEGDTVERDQLLLRLDDGNQQTLVAKADNSLAKSRREFERLEALHAQNLISDQVFSDAKFELRQLELALEDARRELDYTLIRAPLAGTITRRQIKLGDLVTPNQHLFDLVDFASVVARVYVPEKSLATLGVGQVARVTATALANREFAGKVRRIAPVVDAKSGTVKLTLGFDEVGPLRPGMYVDVELILSRKADALLLSKRALTLDGDQTYAFRLREDRTVQRVLVEARVADRTNVEPAQGFQVGDQVVVAGQTGLKDGSKVRLPGDPDSRAGAADAAAKPGSSTAPARS